MTLELKKASPIRLRDVHLDERWLQDKIAEDPSLLGLGDLHVIKRERSQPTGGRIDFLMHDPDAETRYEVELMLGSLDETHIIRTIEYWDIERQRYPTLEHRAVIVAEQITSRFFNVIRLLNRAVPIIALQLNAFRFGDSIVLHFTKVLDVYESIEDEEDESAERVDRRYWERRASAESLAIVDSLISYVTDDAGEPRVTYNRSHVAVGTIGYNFLWLHPRRSAQHCQIHFRPQPDHKGATIARLEQVGLSAAAFRSNAIKVRLTTKDLTENAALIRDVLAQAERASRSQAGDS